MQTNKPGLMKGTPIKLTPEIGNFLEVAIKEDNTLTGKQLAHKVFEKFEVKIFKSTVNDYLAKQNWSYKSVTEEDVARNTEVLIEERFQFAQKMLQKGKRPENPSNIIY